MHIVGFLIYGILLILITNSQFITVIGKLTVELFIDFLISKLFGGSRHKVVIAQCTHCVVLLKTDPVFIRIPNETQLSPNPTSSLDQLVPKRIHTFRHLQALPTVGQRGQRDPHTRSNLRPALTSL